jgi:hypothetical protein
VPVVDLLGIDAQKGASLKLTPLLKQKLDITWFGEIAKQSKQTREVPFFGNLHCTNINSFKLQQIEVFNDLNSQAL